MRSRFLVGLAGVLAVSAAACGGLKDALTAHLKRPEVRERLARLGMRPLTSTPEELARHAAAEMVKWGQVARDAGISPE